MFFGCHGDIFFKNLKISLQVLILIGRGSEEVSMATRVSGVVSVHKDVLLGGGLQLFGG